jgi:hypothetical protein
MEPFSLSTLNRITLYSITWFNHKPQSTKKNYNHFTGS